METRVVYYDTLRGFAILLVVIGHLIQYNYESSIQNGLFNLIYSFHMPLFFFLSGCTRALQENKKGKAKSWKELFSFCMNKCRLLLLPSIAWTLLVPLFFATTWKYNGSISSFWFLNVLFVVSCLWTFILFIDDKLCARKKILWLTIAIFVILFALDIKQIPLMYMALYVFGYFFQQKSWLQKMPDIIYALFLLAFFLGAGYFSYGQTWYGDENRVWLELPLSALASLSLTWLFCGIVNKYINSTLAFFGKYSLGIYLTHFLFVDMPVIKGLENAFNSISQFVILSILAALIALCSTIIEKVIGAFPSLHLLLYGKR